MTHKSDLNLSDVARVERRTFEAKQHPKFSVKREQLNQHPLTSEFMVSYRYAAYKPQAGLSERSCWRTFRTRGEAVYWIEN